MRLDPWHSRRFTKRLPLTEARAIGCIRKKFYSADGSDQLAHPNAMYPNNSMQLVSEADTVLHSAADAIVTKQPLRTGNSPCSSHEVQPFGIQTWGKGISTGLQREMPQPGVGPWRNHSLV